MASREVFFVFLILFRGWQQNDELLKILYTGRGYRSSKESDYDETILGGRAVYFCEISQAV